MKVTDKQMIQAFNTLIEGCKERDAHYCNICPIDKTYFCYDKPPHTIKPEEYESAWEMFQRLCEIYDGILYDKWLKHIPGEYHTTFGMKSFTIIKWFALCPEQEAIKIMQEIEGELENDKM